MQTTLCPHLCFITPIFKSSDMGPDVQEKLPCKQIITSVGSELHTIPKLEVKQRVAPGLLHFNLTLASPGVNEGGKGAFNNQRKK